MKEATGPGRTSQSGLPAWPQTERWFHSFWLTYFRSDLQSTVSFSHPDQFEEGQLQIICEEGKGPGGRAGGEAAWPRRGRRLEEQ